VQEIAADSTDLGEQSIAERLRRWRRNDRLRDRSSPRIRGDDSASVQSDATCGVSGGSPSRSGRSCIISEPGDGGYYAAAARLHPILQLFESFGKLGAQLHGLLPYRGSDPAAERSDQPHEREDNQGSGNAAWDLPGLQSIRASAHRECEQHSKKDRQDEGARLPKQQQSDGESDDRHRYAECINAL
jgi:hypothetical protein